MAAKISKAKVGANNKNLLTKFMSLPLLSRLIVVLAVGLAVVTGGYITYARWQESSLRAKAANWTQVAYRDNVGLWVCQETYKTGGKSYVRIKGVGVKDTKKPAYILVVPFYNETSVGPSAHSSTWWGYVTAVQFSVESSKFNAIGAYSGVVTSGKGGLAPTHKLSKITTC